MAIKFKTFFHQPVYAPGNILQVQQLTSAGAFHVLTSRLKPGFKITANTSLEKKLLLILQGNSKWSKHICILIIRCSFIS